MNLNFILFLIKIKLNFFYGEMVKKKKEERIQTRCRSAVTSEREKRELH
jgi:hypothetical protein